VKLFCATTNSGKLREFQAHPLIEVEPLAGLKTLPPCEETGLTFEANAVQKALHYSPYARGLMIAEDSGIEVEALGGAPGVYSARFAGPAATDEQNNRLLLQKLAGVENRKARYVSVIALAKGSEILATFRGEVVGEIASEARGANGFGYDPLFYYAEFGCTFGEAAPGRKQTVSHRGRAIEKLFAYLLAGFRG
jgi:XTP/dITP diphosphohydrolase